MSAIDTLFAKLRRNRRKAFMPFVTAGDPDLDFTADVIRELVSRGSNICEVGIPYSDPIADGPVIQASYTRALGNHVTLPRILEMLRGLSTEVLAPMVTMVSYSIVWRQGLQNYVARAKSAGVAGAIVPDLLVEEADALAEVCREADFSLIQLVTPTTPRDRALKIAEKTTGFIYFVSVTGITGERKRLPQEIVDNVGWLREQTELPICVGFGISQPDHVRMLAPVADGLIVGSAIVRRVAEAVTKPRHQVLREIGDYVDELRSAMDDA
jgi:tryptophan synthase alpha chain